MSEGLKIRAQIDNDLVKGLLLINGGGSVALLAFLPSILKDPSYAQLSSGILWALPSFSFGLVLALIHNRFRRHCSLEHETHQYRPPACKNVYIKLLAIIFLILKPKPCDCVLSEIFMKISFILFIVGVSFVVIGGFQVLPR